MKILTILGARPQFIKAGTVSREIAKHDDIEEIIVHTGQHFDANMSDIFFKEMQIPKPNYHLDINGLGHGAMTGQMMEKIEEVLLKEKPDWVLVYGDTNSTLAGALAASKLHIKVAHIEAGLRSFNMKMPEEVNRILTDRISSVLFCPTDNAIENLKKEGYESFDIDILNSGDVMYDGALFYSSLAQKPDVDLQKDYILCTIHRAENTDNQKRIRSIFEALKDISLNIQIVLPLHPRTKNILDKSNIQLSKNITIIEPVGYLEMVYLIKNSKLIMTDSGGLQKEAYFFKKPCITLRDETEWEELVDNNFNILVGADKDKILETYNSDKFNKDYSLHLFGDGLASQKIVNYFMKKL
jgi:UDP-GlcNAc3NAcA epimerase